MKPRILFLDEYQTQGNALAGLPGSEEFTTVTNRIKAEYLEGFKVSRGVIANRHQHMYNPQEKLLMVQKIQNSVKKVKKGCTNVDVIIVYFGTELKNIVNHACEGVKLITLPSAYFLWRSTGSVFSKYITNNLIGELSAYVKEEKENAEKETFDKENKEGTEEEKRCTSEGIRSYIKEKTEEEVRKKQEFRPFRKGILGELFY